MFLGRGPGSHILLSSWETSSSFLPKLFMLCHLVQFLLSRPVGACPAVYLGCLQVKCFPLCVLGGLYAQVLPEVGFTAVSVPANCRAVASSGFSVLAWPLALVSISQSSLGCDSWISAFLRAEAINITYLAPQKHSKIKFLAHVCKCECKGMFSRSRN